MNAWKIVCATLLIFITGIITGALLVRFAERGPKPWQRPLKSGVNLPTLPNDPRAPNSTAPGSPLLNREFAQTLSRQLHLTPAQRERIEQIMIEGQERQRALRASLEPQTRKQLAETREQIHALLTPEQRELFERLVKHRTNRRNDGAGQPDSARRERDPRNPLPPREAPPGVEPSPPPAP